MENFSFNTEMEVDLDDVEEFVTSEEFAHYLLQNTTQFSTAAYIFQRLYDCIQEDKDYINNPNDNDDEG